MGTFCLLHGNRGYSKGLSLRDWHRHSGLYTGHSVVWPGVCSVNNIDDAGTYKGLDRAQDGSFFSFLHGLTYCCDKISDNSSLRREGFILAHG